MPLNIRNAPTNLMRDLGYGKGYQYAHDCPDKLADMQCLPDALVGKEYYYPTSEGFERNYGERYYQIKEWKENAARRAQRNADADAAQDAKGKRNDESGK